MKKQNNKVKYSGFLACILLMTISLVPSTNLSAQVDTLWSIQAPTSNWFGIGNAERGLTLNPSTGNLILASRQGGVTPVIIDSETGDSLGLLKTSKPASEAPTPVWSFSAPQSTWFGTGNTERGLGFNPATGNLIVASRQGGVTPILIDAATGDSVGMLKTIRSAKENPEALWTITAPTSNWFGTGNTERGLGFNPSTGNLIVASRQGGVTPILIDAATGDSVGMLKTIRSAKENPEALWTITAPTSNWFGTGNTERGLGFNPATGNLIVASRQGGVTPVLVDAATGDSVGILSNTGISGGIFPFNQIKATSDGQIFTANLAINGESRIYRWADETADPELVFADSLGQRLGDSFGVIGSGDSVHVFLSGTGATKVAPFFWDGTTLSKTADYTVAASEARGGFSGHAIADSIVITGTGTAPRYMNALDGTLGTQLASADVASGDLNSVMVNDQFTYKGKHYVVAGPAFTNGKFYMLDVTDPANATLVHELGPIGNNTNGNNTGGVVFDDATGRLYIMDTNNAIAAYSMSDFVDMPVISGGIFPFNQIKASADGQIFTANLAINGESRIYRWADESAEPELVYAGELGGRLGDSFGVIGSGDSVHVFLSGTGATKVAPFFWDGTTLSKTADYTVAASEARGGFSGHAIADSIVITGTGTAPRYMNALDGTLGTQLASADVASGDLNSVMVNDQFTYKGKHYVVAGPAFTNGKFYMLDVTDPANATLVHELGPIGNNTNGNNTGGVVFDDATGRLYIMDTNNAIAAYSMSDFVDMPVISGGIFPFNQIKATIDGQIFTANLAINGTTKIYRWADESSTPELIYQGDLGGRLGDSFGVIGEGAAVRVFLSGSGAEKVAAFNWNGSTLDLLGEFPVAAGEARGGFSSHVVGDSILISGTGTAPRFMHVGDGGLGTQLMSDDVASGDLNSVMINDQIVYKGRHLVAVGPAFTNGKFYVLDVTDGVTLLAELGPLGTNKNLNNTGGAIFDGDGHMLYLMDTNNALIAYDMNDFFASPVISGGIFPFNKIKATSDGQIFTANLAINGVTKIYRWANESAAPEEIFADSLGQRLGDSFAAYGSGDDVTLLLSGSGTDKVVVFNWNGSTLSKTSDYSVSPGEARGGFSNHPIDDEIWITGTSTAPRIMNVKDGTLGSTFFSSSVTENIINSSMVNDQAMIGNRHLVALGPAFANGKFYLFDITEGEQLLTEIGPLGVNTNGNGTGEIVFDPSNSRLYLMETNNAVIAIDLLATGLVSNENLASVPVNFKLYDNYPNPFNPSTNIQYDLPVASDVSIKVYDIQGRMIANIAKGQQAAGTYTHRFDAGSMASGMYIYRIEAGSFVATKKMMLIK